MTNEEALKIIDKRLKCQDHIRCNDCPAYYCSMCELNTSTKELVESIKVAAEALKQKIKRKPRLEGDGYWDGELVMDTWFCPNCGASFDLEGERDQYKMCPECGQAIDWSEVEE